MPEVVAVGTAESRTSGSRNDALTVMTLNIAHGRGTGFHQLFQDADTAAMNLDRISLLLEQERVDVVALQEADGPSFWSGNFSHVRYLAEKAGFSWLLRGEHVGMAGLSYGTALVSRYRPQAAESVTFDPSVSMTRKGFVASTIEWPGRPGVLVDMVSVHLAFDGEAARSAQAQQLVEVMRGRGRPVVMMGDFNTGLEGSDSALHYIMDELGLAAWLPGAGAIQTFPSSGGRLDWILLSSELQFNSCKVVDVDVSDHRGVVAEIIPAVSGEWRVAARGAQASP